MVMLSSTLRGRVVKYHNTALKPNTLLVVSLEGREAISRPYRYEIDFVSQDAEIDPHAVLTTPGFLGMKQGVALSGGGRGIQSLKIHGLLSTFEQSGKALDWITYRGVLVPRLWTLSLNVQSRIFLDRTVPQIVEDVLKAAGFASDDYDMRANGRTYPKREYVVQYQESDLDFISRLMEHEGISYYFEQGDEKEKVVFADAPAGFVPMPGTSTFRYQPSGAGAVGSGDWFEEEVIRSFVARDRLLQKEVVLRDYNYRTPSVDLKVQEPAVEKGQGTFYEYGDHYKTADEGKAYARVRAEEIKCRQKTFTAGSEIRGAHAGLQFTLTDHYRAEFSTTYLITEVRAKLTQAIDLTARQGQTRATYQNEFDCIFADTPFRPARLTPKPKIVGTLNAKVDAAGDGKYAELDDQGRYKVILPFDLSGRKDGKATRFIRMAQPYSGPDYGFHFPLHKNAEVILTHIDGDPDRPIIASAVPNPEMGTTVKGANQSQCAIVTGGGNKLVLEDSDGGQQMALYSPTESTSFNIGAGCIDQKTDGCANEQIGIDKDVDVGANKKEKVGGTSTIDVVGDYLLSVAANVKEEASGAWDKTVKGKLTKMVLGPYFEIVAGLKSSTIGGVKHETVVGGDFKLSAAYKIDKNAIKSTKTSSIVSVTAGAQIKHVAPAIRINGYAKAEMVSGDSSAKCRPGSARLDSGAKVDVNAGGPLALWGGGSAKLESGGPVGVEAGGPVTVKGASAKVEAGTITLKGTVTVDGQTNCKKDVDIKGHLYVTESGHFCGSVLTWG